MNAIDFHGAIATQFDSKYESSVAFGERFRIWIALFRRYVRPGDCVLDLGCGSGIFSQYLAGMNCYVTGIDGSAEMIDLCNRKKASAYVRYSVELLPLSSPADYTNQDVVVASSLLEYIDDLEPMLQQIRAMLRPDGLLIVSMPNRLSLYRRIERILFGLTGRPRYFAHIRQVADLATFNHQLTRLGYATVETMYFSSYDPLSNLLKWVLPKRYVNNLFVGVYRRI